MKLYNNHDSYCERITLHRFHARNENLIRNNKTIKNGLLIDTVDASKCFTGGNHYGLLPDDAQSVHWEGKVEALYVNLSTC